VTDKYADLQDKISVSGGTRFYKPVKGDLIDECFAQHLNESPLDDVPVRRLQPGIYMFGTKQVYVKLNKGSQSLAVRIGGGYTSAQ